MQLNQVLCLYSMYNPILINSTAKTYIYYNMVMHIHNLHLLQHGLAYS